MSLDQHIYKNYRYFRITYYPLSRILFAEFAGNRNKMPIGINASCRKQSVQIVRKS